MGLMMTTAVFAQENQVNRIPTVGKDPTQTNYVTLDRGLWFSAEALGGYSCYLHGHNMGLVEVDVTAGYRFNEYLKVGLGLGGRYYISQQNLRRHDDKWGMPIFATVRGNIIPGKYRHTVPYWGVEAGASIRDGFFFRPTIGMRIGELREAFTLGLSYMGQNIATYKGEGPLPVKGDRFTNFVCVRLGYEF